MSLRIVCRSGPVFGRFFKPGAICNEPRKNLQGINKSNLLISLETPFITCGTSFLMLA